MAAAVYGGSPRHASRQSAQVAPHHGYHTQHSPYHQANIIIPPASYLSSSSIATSATTSPYHLRLAEHQTHARDRSSKRKSAVELLAESKPFYVKSETVLDRQQQLNIRGGSHSTSSYMLSPSRTLPPQQRTIASRRSASSGSDLLQTKLRKLLNADQKEKLGPDSLLSPPQYHHNSLPGKYDTYHGHGKSLSLYQQAKNYHQQLTVHPEPQSDVSVFFPSAFLSPQSLPPHPVGDDDLYSYGIDDGLVLTDDYRAISPPAEYAENTPSPKDVNGANSKYAYQRSHSHSQAVASGSGGSGGDDSQPYSPSYNINSHKSLPDLHISSSRHSPHSEALSCCSRGNRSNRSSSSFNRDSGGSSGHYTHRSEPCCKQQQHLEAAPQLPNAGVDYRRDSGSSTQHSGNSGYYAYGIPPLRYDCIECRARLREEADCLLNFTTPEVPEAFQDDYEAKKKYYDRDDARQFFHKPTSATPLSPLSPLSPVSPHNTTSPPLGAFKRQKCLRFKNRGRYSTSPRNDDDRRPILRSKSDISDRYWNRNGPLMEPRQAAIEKRGRSESLSQLERFFDRLGLDDENYEEHIAPKSKSNYSSDNDSDQSSAVFFSDVSTVDSTRLPDSTETSQPGAQATGTAPYRPSEPPSIIERNARIIKWLCHCKKSQLA